jgi:hypothetical protein
MGRLHPELAAWELVLGQSERHLVLPDNPMVEEHTGNCKEAVVHTDR